MVSIELTNGKRFDAKADESLLDAATRAGIQLNYSCKTGRCSTCKCKLISGEVAPLQESIGLSRQEQAEGWILSCISSATTNMVLEADDLGNLHIPKEITLPCRINQIDLLAPDVIRVLLRFPPLADFHFLPGQYVEVIGPSGIRRSYSLANLDFQKKQLELHIRKLNGGYMSNYWFSQAKLNDLLRIRGPLGTFCLRNSQGMNLIFLATGTGIAPVKSMLESIASMPKDTQPNSVHVLWGGRTTTDFYIKLENIPGIHQSTYVLSRPHPEWKGATGYVQDIILKNYFCLKQAIVYACGSETMITNAKKSLTNAGLSPKCFYSDAFVSSASLN